ncbi:MAG: hypothetical protein IPJ57_01270 [Gemmatimonadetes bacterium]|nr:hypothetical protein [Gemmatimonadota bacterium]
MRRAILAADARIGEEIKWNAPAFFYTGPMAPFDPKEYRRHLVVFNFYRQDGLRLVFWHGDRAKDRTPPGGTPSSPPWPSCATCDS